MKVTIVHCGPAANESERLAVETLKAKLQGIPGEGEWILLTNLPFAVTHQFQADEIDIVAIGPPGVRVIEVKHWEAKLIEGNPAAVDHEADKLTAKAKRIGTTARKVIAELPRTDGVILLTTPASKLKRVAGRMVRGVSLHTLAQWKEVLDLGGPAFLTPIQVQRLSRALAPRSSVVLDGKLRHLAGYVNLQLQSPPEERFHRVYRGSHPERRDRVVLHLYDLSADDDANAAVKARRESDSLRRLQLYRWAPRILDSFQEAPGYSGEMYFFTVIDPAAPCIEERAQDRQWDIGSRLLFARDSVRALKELHGASEEGEAIVHRNLTPKTILVRHDNTPAFVGFERARIPTEMSIASSGIPETEYPTIVPPEVMAAGLGAADQRSDIFSLCASLRVLFTGAGDGRSEGAHEILSFGVAKSADDRCTLDDLDSNFSQMLGESPPPPPPPPAQYWSEEQLIRFGESDFQIVTRLGKGSFGSAFKVVELDLQSNEELGSYVAKVLHDEATGERLLRAYRQVRSIVGRHEGLSAIYQVANEWRKDNFSVLMAWIDGSPLAEYAGVFALFAEEEGELQPEALALRWLDCACRALEVLHRNGWTHGDISPRNVIATAAGPVLTDYDFVTRIGEKPFGPGTHAYCSPERGRDFPAAISDDLYALAATFFHVLFDREPFLHGGELAKNRGLNWHGLNRDEYPMVAAVLNRATHRDPAERFHSATEMRSALDSQRPANNERPSEVDLTNGGPDVDDDSVVFSAHPETKDPGERPPSEEIGELSEQHVEWLRNLLKAYPGSRWGNQETRGLDTSFAADTYVPTPLEATLLRDIRDGRVRLVILCGNAGDGKTALLQHIAQELGLGRHSSSERILEGRVSNGPRVRMNLDGSASWKGESADDILDQFLAPFHEGAPRENIVHLLAVNDGRLLEWMEGVEDRMGVSTPLLHALYDLLNFTFESSSESVSHIRFISLNQRSLVGGFTTDRARIETRFLDQLVDQLYGGDSAADKWSVCRSCSAQDRCHVFQAAGLFGPEQLAHGVSDDVRRRARERLFAAFQAVHLRGETHITVRELRAALVYILFGVNYCDDYHQGTYDSPPYWDRVFAADSPARQGELLRELVRFDPALESHPKIDRFLLTRPSDAPAVTAPHYHNLKLESARRRAYFEWTEEHLRQVGQQPDSLDLARGRHLADFRDIPRIREADRLAEITRRLCGGISRLEDLPPQALDRPGVVPLRITPRTPTETAFWVEKPLDRFRIEPELPQVAEGMELLHRQVLLIYRYRDGTEERLRLGAELFHLLLELADGYQLGDVSTDDTFAHLSIFVKRLVRENERELLAWNPMRDEDIFHIAAEIRGTPEEPLQRIEITPLGNGERS